MLPNSQASEESQIRSLWRQVGEKNDQKAKLENSINRNLKAEQTYEFSKPRYTYKPTISSLGVISNKIRS